MPRRDLIAARTLALACLTCLAACGAPATMQTTPLEHAMTALPPTMPSPPAHRGALELSIGGEAQSILRTAERSPPDLSHYVRPASGEIAIGGRFSRFVGARLIGELGLPSPPTDAHQRNLLGAGLPGRLGGAVVLGYTSEASVVHATLSLEGGLHVIGIQRLLLVETRTCPFDGFGFGPCTPWSFAGLAGTTGLDLLPYVRVTAVLGVVVLEWLRFFVQAGVGTTPRLGGTARAPSYAHDFVFGIEPGVEASLGPMSLILTGGWSSADALTYGPRVGLAMRAAILDGPGSEVRERQAECVADRRRWAREHRRARRMPAGAYWPEPVDPDCP
ncbi:MAG: hypothetical protein J0L92_27820 [Deltaproteobacteria bacterium]|nr:hypothetical protein [Deltaproteobacteria bacterium]